MSDGDAKSATASPPDRTQSRIGSVVDKYTIVRLLGKGGMGAVYEARHAKLARRFAIKFLLPELAANREVLRRFENEAKAAGGLEHPNLAAVTDVGQAEDGAPYLVMEFLEGDDVAKVLRQQGALPVRRAADIVLQACRALAVAHRAGIVHRDLKPENLFLAVAGDGRDHVKVLDFVIAKLRTTDASVVTGTGATFGTAFYMSPEQARGAGEVDHRSDVWSLGVVLYELLSGRKPFEGGTFLEVIHKILSTEPTPLEQLRPGVPAPLAAVVRQAMRKELIERLPSVVALGEALAPFANGPLATGASGLAETAPSARTQPTPVTRPPPVTTLPLPAVPRMATAPAPGHRTSRRTLGISLGLALVGTVVAALILGSHRTTTPAQAPAAAVASAPPSVAAPTATAALAAPPSLAAPAAATSPPSAPTAPSAPTHAVEAPRANTTERPEHRSNRRDHPRFIQTDEPAATPSAPPAPPKPAPPLAPARAGHPIDIEKDNPYGN